VAKVVHWRAIGSPRSPYDTWRKASAGASGKSRVVREKPVQIFQGRASHLPKIAGIAFDCCRVWLALGLLSTPAAGQSQPSARIQGSELARENLSRVAASAAEIKIILVKDPGLLVELKRWVAKDATGHGQIVRDSDLTDDAIFLRLETDLPFRSAATELVQRYGYLRPQLNPASDLAKERELLAQERAKWLAQEEEQERTRARQRGSGGVQTARGCDPSVDSGCAELPRGRESLANEPPPSGAEAAPPRIPGGDTQRENPSQRESPVDRTQLMQPGEELADELGGLSSAESFSLNAGAAGLPPAALDAALSGGDFGRAGMGGGALPIANAVSGAGRDRAESIEGAAIGATGLLWDSEPGSNGEIAGAPPSGIATARAGAPGTASAPTRTPSSTGLVRKPSPYDDIPSLYDMYMQAAPRPSEPKRFGLDVFARGIRDSKLIPMDLPAGPDYVLGPGDGLTIDLWGGVSRRFYRTVDREGRVSLPEVGPIPVSGKSLGDVQLAVQQVLRSQFRDVSADVSLGRLRTIRVYEVGDVATPGAYDVSSLSTPLNALFAAGGPTSRGSMRIVKHYRGNKLVQVVDMYDLLLHGVKGDLERLENGDTVLVPPLGPEVTVEGMVRRPAIYELNGEKNLASVVELAGGLLPLAALKNIEVQRTVAHEKKTMLSFDLPESTAGYSAEIAAKLESFEIQDGDRIRVFPIAPYNQDAVYLEGHVLRPGRYSYRQNLRVTDIVSSYKDLLPEPAGQYAEIIRLNPPDFHPSVEGFDLADALANPEQAPLVHPLDTIRVFSRYDFENPPTVSVWGAVRAPGTYRTSGQIRLADAVHLAGGLGPDAETADAQVFRHEPDGRMKIFSVNLTGALAGDPAANLLLESRDRLLIHRNPEAVEPASVYIQGEVAKPGRYPLTANMTIADLIKVGGGLKPGADPETADLTRFQYNGVNLTGRHEAVSIPAALAGGQKQETPLNNGDVLAVRQLPGWNDLGASISVKGEVVHPGTYGIRPGERLSSVLERAGGFLPSAYPYGAILERAQVREIETKQRNEMILRVKDLQTSLESMPEIEPRQKQIKQAAQQQYQETLAQLNSNPPVGRVTIRISANIKHWKNSADDIEARAGDELIIPKTPSYVLVSGQVYNPTAVSYRSGKSAQWYLSQSGGPTPLANRKSIFVVRADGSVIGSNDSPWTGNSLGAVLHPGDTVVVPEKAIGPGVNWQNVFASAQVASAITSTLFIALHY